MGYPTDLNDKQWALIEPLFIRKDSYGNRTKWEKRTLTNAVLYIHQTHCRWSDLPHDYPPFHTVWTFYSRAKDNGLWEKITKKLTKSGYRMTTSFRTRAPSRS